MRFTTASLLTLVVVTAVFLAFIRTHPVSTLAYVSVCTSACALVNALQHGQTSARSLAPRGAFAAFLGMMVFGLLTIACWIGYSYLHSPGSRQYVEQNYDWYLIYTLKFVVIFGLNSIVGGAILGLMFSYAARRIHRQRM